MKILVGEIKWNIYMHTYSMQYIPPKCIHILPVHHSNVWKLLATNVRTSHNCRGQR